MSFLARRSGDHDGIRARRKLRLALPFAILMNGQKLTFRLPSDWHPVQAIIPRGKKKPGSWHKDRLALWEAEWRDQAVRVSWRIIKDWVEAQMALVETQMVTTAQVFCPTRSCATAGRSPRP
jgi:hypothetical protein